MKTIKCVTCGGDFQVKNKNKLWVNCSNCRLEYKNKVSRNQHNKRLRELQKEINDTFKYIKIVKRKETQGFTYIFKNEFRTKNYKQSSLTSKEIHIKFIKDSIKQLEEELKIIEQK